MDFDEFVNELVEEAKAFYEKAKNCQDKFTKKACLNASLLLSLSYLESCVNSIISELMIEPYNEIYSLNEQALLLEKEISFKNGSFQLANGLKMSRLIDRIELLHYKTTGIKLNQSDTWFSTLKQSINLRNKLVHPKDAIELTDRQVEIAISSVIETVNHLYQAVYKKKLPYYNLGLSSKFDIK